MKCDKCFYFSLMHKWVNTPFRLGGTTLKGIDCFGVSLRIAQEVGLITERQFNTIHSANALRVLRRKGSRAFKEFVTKESKGVLVETTDTKDLKCGDWVIRFVGKNYDVESALYVGEQFITAMPNMSVTIVPTFDFDFVISWGGFSFKRK